MPQTVRVRLMPEQAIPPPNSGGGHPARKNPERWENLRPSEPADERRVGISGDLLTTQPVSHGHRICACSSAEARDADAF